MTNPAIIRLENAGREKCYIIIEPILKKVEDELISTGVFKLYKSALDNESALFTEPLEKPEDQSDLPDGENPDYLGKMTFEDDAKWQFEGDLLSKEEQTQIAARILSGSDR